MYEYGHNLSWEVWRAEWDYLSQTLLTWQIDNLCGGGIMWQLQSHPHCSGYQHGGHVLLSVISGEVSPSETDVRSDYNEWVFDCNQFLSLKLSVQDNFTHNIQTLQQFGMRGDSRPGQNMRIVVFFNAFQLNTRDQTSDSSVWDTYSSPGQDSCGSKVFISQVHRLTWLKVRSPTVPAHRTWDWGPAVFMSCRFCSRICKQQHFKS